MQNNANYYVGVIHFHDDDKSDEIAICGLETGRAYTSPASNADSELTLESKQGLASLGLRHCAVCETALRYQGIVPKSRPIVHLTALGSPRGEGICGRRYKFALGVNDMLTNEAELAKGVVCRGCVNKAHLHRRTV